MKKYYRVTNKGWDFNDDLKILKYVDLKVPANGCTVAIYILSVIVSTKTGKNFVKSSKSLNYNTFEC